MRGDRPRPSAIHVFVNASDVPLAQRRRKTRREVLEMAEAGVRRALGIAFPDPGVETVFRRFQALAERKREVDDADLRALFATLAAEVPAGGWAGKPKAPLRRLLRKGEAARSHQHRGA